ncbi:MAG TPA: ornithine--oxo-acid transaminase [Thermoanaerobaculia bacterium]|nr:ornithine--oxo-acid transaminase [Thermoanaerobaculia bacterium]
MPPATTAAPATTPSTAEDFIALEDRYGARNYKPLDVVIDRAEGAWVWDVSGRKYLDCLAAYSAVNQGHCHPKIVQAMIEQAQKVALTSRAFRNSQLGPFYQELCELTGYAKALPMNSGAEAVESAIKLARKWSYQVKGVEKDKAEILVFRDNFHGRTTAIVGFSSEPQYREGFGPFAPGFRLLPYGDAAAVAAAIGPNTAAILVEPIQGEAGILIPPDGYLQKLRKLATENNVLLIADEIQSGLGRTGKMLACEHEDVRPDILILGKALSGGMYPVSAVLADEEVMGVFRPGDHGSTFGGNPLAAAVGRAALRVLVEEKLVERSATLGAKALERLQRTRSPHVKLVRGRGLWIGIELHSEAGGARRFCEALQREGVLCKETHDNVIRFAPPLVIREEDLDWALGAVERVLGG